MFPEEDKTKRNTQQTRESIRKEVSASPENPVTNAQKGKGRKESSQRIFGSPKTAANARRSATEVNSTTDNTERANRQQWTIFS